MIEWYANINIFGTYDIYIKDQNNELAKINAIDRNSLLENMKRGVKVYSYSPRNGQHIRIYPYIAKNNKIHLRTDPRIKKGDDWFIPANSPSFITKESDQFTPLF